MLSHQPRVLAIRSGSATAVLVALIVGSSAHGSPDHITKAGAYLVARQGPSGSFFTADQPAHATAETLEAVSLAKIEGEVTSKALEYLRNNGPADAKQKPAYAARIAMGLIAAGKDAHSFGDFDYVREMQRDYNPATGSYDTTNLYANAVTALGIIRAGEALPARALAFFAENQCDNGGFAHQFYCLTGRPDIDTTALVIKVLIAAAHPSTAVGRGRRFLVESANSQGAFGYEPNKETNANSTALALSAIGALGEDPTQKPWSRSGSDPLETLLDLQQPNGRFAWMAGDPAPAYDDYASVQAVIGLSTLPSDLFARPTRSSDSAPTATQGLGVVRPEDPVTQAPSLMQDVVPPPPKTPDTRMRIIRSMQSSSSTSVVPLVALSIFTGALLLLLITDRQRRHLGRGEDAPT